MVDWDGIDLITPMRQNHKLLPPIAHSKVSGASTAEAHDIDQYLYGETQGKQLECLKLLCV